MLEAARELRVRGHREAFKEIAGRAVEWCRGRAAGIEATAGRREKESGVSDRTLRRKIRGRRRVSRYGWKSDSASRLMPAWKARPQTGVERWQNNSLEPRAATTGNS